MHTQRPATLVAMMLMTASLAVGCDDATGAGVDDVEFAGEGEVSLRPGSGGIWLNTSSIGSKAFSSFDLTGALHDGVKLIGAKVKKPDNKWAPVSAGEVIDGQLRARVGNTYYTGAQLVNSRWTISIVDYDYDHDDDNDDGYDDNGERVVEIWISAYSQVAPNEGHYTFQTLDELGQPAYICDADADGGHASIPVKDIAVDHESGDIVARPKTLYLACKSGAIGKAITWGYKPWQRTLTDFEVATRMVRADYCFDGTSWTQEGTALQIRDVYDINDFVYETEPTEVVWTTAGVACLTQPRNPTYDAPQVTCGGQVLATCPEELTLSSFPNARFWTKVDTLL